MSKNKDKVKKKGSFRAFVGVDANKYFMFKSDAARHSLRTVNIVMKILITLSLIALIVFATLFVGALIVWLLAVIVTLTLILLKDDWGVDGWLSRWMEKMMTAFVVSLVVFVATYVVRFIVEWVFIIAESARLKRNPEENADYLAVAKEVKLTKITGFIAMILAGTLFYCMSFFKTTVEKEGGGTKTGYSPLGIILAVAAAAVLLAAKIFSYKRFMRVSENIDRIKASRAVEKN